MPMSLWFVDMNQRVKNPRVLVLVTWMAASAMRLPSGLPRRMHAAFRCF